MKKLAIVTTHPIQYNAPLFKVLSERNKIFVKVFYTWGQTMNGEIFDPGFKIKRGWDIPLLQGYESHFSRNDSSRPGSDHFNGICNPTLISDIEAFNPDAIMVYGWKFRSHLKLLRYFKGKIPLLFRGDSTLLDDHTRSFIKRFLRRKVLTYVYKHIDFALFTGKYNQDYYKKYGVPNDKLIFMPHAIDNERFALACIVNYREQLGISEDTFIFLFAGKLETKKDPELLLRTFCKIKTKDMALIIVGSGPLDADLKNGYSSLSGVYFLPFQNQSCMPSVYMIADVFILPSKGPEETWGLAVNEAMAAGKPVIVSDKCGCSADLVIEGRNGYKFKSGNEDDLGKKMTKMYKKGRLNAQGMGIESRKVIANWSFDKCASILESLIIDKIKGM
jgi:glycosyltransferase involved in cell wall biosynthesis